MGSDPLSDRVAELTEAGIRAGWFNPLHRPAIAGSIRATIEDEVAKTSGAAAFRPVGPVLIDVPIFLLIFVGIVIGISIIAFRQFLCINP